MVCSKQYHNNEFDDSIIELNLPGLFWIILLVSMIKLLFLIIISLLCGSLALSFGPAFACFLIVVPVLFIWLARHNSVLLKSVIILYPLLPLLAISPGGITFLTGQGLNLAGFINISTVALITGILINRKFALQLSFATKLLLVAFILCLVIGVMSSSYKFFSLREFTRYSMALSVFFLTRVYLLEGGKIDALYELILISTTIPIVTGIIQIIFPNSLYVTPLVYKSRVFGTFLHPNSYAMFLIVLVNYFIYQAGLCSSSYRKVYVCGVVIAVLLLFSTFTRIAWLCCGVCLIFWGIIYYKRILLFLCGVFGSFAIILPQIYKPITDRFYLDDSYWTRFHLNSLSMELFQQKPIFGHGLGVYSILSQSETGAAATNYGIKTGLVPHNDYFRFLVATGGVGLILLGLVFILSFYQAFKLFQSNDFMNRRFSIFFVMLVISIMILALSDQSFEVIGFYFWLFLALLEHYLFHAKRQKR